ncbi:MAG: porin family protein [Tannerella sp.]|jgi:outer membrane protein X|nr:porin family protein [Tannerella sp.]
MKRLFLTGLLALVAASGYAQSGSASVSAKTGYALDWETVTLGADYRYNFLPEFRLAPSLTYMIRNQGPSAWYMDLDCHYIVEVSELFSFYPIGGIGISIWQKDLLNRREDAARLGINIGLGGELQLSPEISVGVDMKYNLITTYDQALVAIRVAYHL